MFNVFIYCLLFSLVMTIGYDWERRKHQHFRPITAHIAMFPEAHTCLVQQCRIRNVV